MEKAPQLQDQLLRSRKLPVVVVVLVLGILAILIVLVTWRVRTSIRQQLADRDGQVLHAVALMQYTAEVESDMAGPLQDPATQLAVVLKTSQLKGVMGARLYDPQGDFVESFPPSVREAPLGAEELTRLKQLRPASRFYPKLSMVKVFYPEKPATGSEVSIPLLEINVPLQAGPGLPLEGIAQFLLEGNSLQAEYDRLDRQLAWQAVAAFSAASLLLLLTMGWAYRRLRIVQTLLTRRTEDLARANQELALSAKTSALGAVTAHLLHGLKNPLAGLENFVTAHSASEARGETVDWEQAVVSTRRMHAMIQQVVTVLHEEQTGLAYEITLQELAEMVQSRIHPMAESAGVRFECAFQSEVALSNRTAHLVALILTNLAQNAVQATLRGRAVSIQMSQEDAQLTFYVRDEGSGFPADLPLFRPCRSTRKEGSGIGLALSQQLALHLGARLELATNTPQGCCFILILPTPIPGKMSKQTR